MNIDKEELSKLIRDIIAEERAESLAHPGRREKITRYTDPEGKTWVSMTLERTEMVQKIMALFLTLCSVLSIVNYAVIRFAVEPAIHIEIDKAIDDHEVQVRARMNEMAPNIVTQTEFKAWTSEKTEKWKNQEIFNAGINDRLKRIEEKLDRLIERR